MRHGIKILGLSLLAALSLMAVTAVAAQAESEIQVEGKALAEGEEAELEGTGKAGKLLVPGIGLTVECTESKIKGTATNLKKVGHGKVHVLFHGCKVPGNKFCSIYPTAADRTAKTNAGLILASALYLILLITPTFHIIWLLPLTEKGPFTTLFFTVGGGCTLPAENTVNGTTGLRIANAKTEATEHEFQDLSPLEEEEVIKSKMEIGLFFGKEPATLDEGNALAHLIGKFLGKKWSLN